jgi:hypothetical protein
MIILGITLAFVALFAGPYALVMAMPRLSQALVAAVAIAGPMVLLAGRHLPVEVFLPPLIWQNTEAILVVTSLLSTATAVLVRTSVAAIGDRARTGAAFVTLNVSWLALILALLPWVADLIAQLPARAQ